jgi:hypothetical protein
VHIGGMVEKCIVSICLRPCKHSGCPSYSCVQGSNVRFEDGVWDASVPTPDERTLRTAFRMVGWNALTTLRISDEFCTALPRVFRGLCSLMLGLFVSLVF